MKPYMIKPLVWETVEKNERWQRYEAETPFGDYCVFRFRDSGRESWSDWEWGYCFAEYFDEEDERCHSLKEGKQKAWEHWVERMLPALEEAERMKQAVWPVHGD